MSESDHSSVELQRLMLLSDSDMAAAAQQLMQLSGEDSNSSTSVNSNGNSKTIKIKAKMIESGQGLFEQSQCEITSAKGLPRKRSLSTSIFPASTRRRTGPKKPRYRLLESIYRQTKPVQVSYQE